MDSSELIFLYVENDADSRQVMDILMRKRLGNKHLTIFEDSENFLERVAELTSAPDVFLLDIHVGPLDGYAMLEQIRNDARYADKFVVAITASVMVTEVDELKAAGFDGLIGKPLDKELFPRLLQDILRGESVWYIP
jgi:two-component system, cell cycle response regulator DivK